MTSLRRARSRSRSPRRRWQDDHWSTSRDAPPAGGPRERRQHYKDDDDEAPHFQQVAWGQWMARETSESVLALAERCGHRFSARNLATAVHRVGKLGGQRVRSDRRLHDLARVCKRKVDTFDARCLADMAWGFAKTGFGARDLFEAIEAAAAGKVSDFEALDITKTVWAFAIVDVAQLRTKFFGVIAAAAVTRSGEFTPQGVAQTVWAFAFAGIAAEGLFEALAGASLNRLGDFSPQSLAQTAWAFANAGVRAPQLFDAIAAETLRRLKEFYPLSVADVLWAFACVGWKDRELFARLLASSSSSSPRNLVSLSRRKVSDRYLAALYVQRNWPNLDDSRLSSLSLRSAYVQSKHSTPKKFQRNVAATLRDLGWKHTVDYETLEGLSLALVDAESKCAVEVDGPSQYLRDAYTGDYVIDGETRLKACLLRSLGWKVTRVAYFEWEASKFESERHALLAAKLAELGVDLAPPRDAALWRLHDLL